MADFVFPVSEVPTLPVVGSDALYPVRRIFCVGRNYVAHAKEMGGDVDRAAPWYFTKSCFALAQSGAELPYAPGTSDLHHEMEMVVALGAEIFQGDVAAAEAAVWGYGCGVDMTRRDLQAHAKETRRPWSLSKDFEGAAVIGALTPASEVGDLSGRTIRLTVGSERRQDATLDEMVWSVPEVIAHLSAFYHLAPGDLIMTGTPAGVSPLQAGDTLVGEVAGLAPVHLTITPAQ